MELRLEYIFLCVDNLGSDYNFPIDYLKSIPSFESLENDSILFTIENTVIGVNYTTGCYNETTFYLNVIYKTEDIEKDIDIFSIINGFIINHSRDKGKFSVVRSYDCISQYYCNKAYPYFNNFEREFRNLLYKILTKVYSHKWVDAVVSQDIIDKLKERGIKKHDILTTQLLYEVDIGQIIGLIFTEKRFNVDSIIDEKLSSEQLSKLTKRDIIIQLEKLRKKTIAERFFSSYIVSENLKGKFEKIRDCRNSIAHTKFFTKKEYQEFVSIIEIITPQIREMSSKIETIEFDDDFLDSVSEMNDVFENVGKLTIAAGLYGLSKFSNWLNSQEYENMRTRIRNVKLTDKSNLKTEQEIMKQRIEEREERIKKRIQVENSQAQNADYELRLPLIHPEKDT